MDSRWVRPPFLGFAYIERFVCLVTATEASLVSSGDVNQPVLGLRSGLQVGLPVGQVELRDGLLLDLGLLDDLLNDGSGGGDRGGSRQVGLGLVEPALDTVREGNLLLSHSKSWEEGDDRGEAHDAEELMTRGQYRGSRGSITSRGMDSDKN